MRGMPSTVIGWSKPGTDLGNWRLSEITGPTALLVEHMIGEWIFTPAAAGTEITWRWDIRPRSALTA